MSLLGYSDGVSGPFDEITVTICPDARRVRSLEFRLQIERYECVTILHVYTQVYILFETLFLPISFQTENNPMYFGTDILFQPCYILCNVK